MKRYWWLIIGLIVAGVISVVVARRYTILSQTCGGIIGELCPSGYRCDIKDPYPDAQGTCVPTKEFEKLASQKPRYLPPLLKNKQYQSAESMMKDYLGEEYFATHLGKVDEVSVGSM